MAQKRINPKENQYRPNARYVFMKITLSAMSKGLFLPFGFVCIILFVIYRLPKEELSPLVKEFFKLITEHPTFGYVLSVIFLVGWFIHARRQRKINEREMKRVTDERNKYQSITGDKPIESSYKG